MQANGAILALTGGILAPWGLPVEAALVPLYPANLWRCSALTLSIMPISIQNNRATARIAAKSEIVRAFVLICPPL